MKKRLREGAKLIVVDPRRIDLVRLAACRGRLSSAAAARHQRRRDQRAGARDRHRRPRRRSLHRASAATGRSSRTGRRSSREPENSPGSDCERSPACRRRRIRAAPRGCIATGGNGAIYYGLGVTEHSQGSTMVMAHRQPRHGDRQHRPRRRRREPAARPEQRAGLVRHGLVPARAARLPPRLRRRGARHVRERCGASSSIPSRACAFPTCSTRRSTARFKGLYVQGEDIAAVRPRHAST